MKDFIFSLSSLVGFCGYAAAIECNTPHEYLPSCSFVIANGLDSESGTNFVPVLVS